MADKTFTLEIVTPQRVVFSGNVVSLSAPGVMGGFQVLHSHAPMLAEIGIGEVKLQEPNGTEVRYATSGGIVDVLDNHVLMLSESVERSSDIDRARAETARDKARRQLERELNAPERTETQAALDRALNRIRIAERG
jgi:F-type H+-transporting ATPase subunit epsilon